MRPTRHTIIAAAASMALLIGSAACRHSQDGAPPAFVKDVDGNTYPTVVSGAQVWLGANLRAAHTASGAPLPTFAPDDNPDNIPLFGRLYTWEAARQACPVGWRLPSDDDWSRLEASLGRAAGSLLRHPMPSTSTPAATPAIPLATLSFPPAGYHNEEGFESFFGSRAVLWTATPQDDHFVWSRVITSAPPYLRRAPQHPQYAFSVRCILDAPSASTPPAQPGASAT